jgi:tRNA pseudouridine55 synthase
VPGILLAHKPVGATSFSLVLEVQTALAASPGKPWKVCHGGVLDPFAGGLLPILIGPATKLFERLHEVPKTYEAKVVWGIETDSGDGGGAVIRTGDSSALTEAALIESLTPFFGWTKQVPPATSNKRVDGERAYQKAHRGEAVNLSPGDVFLHRAHWVSHSLPTSSVLRLTCRGGFYVRSLVRDLGQALGCGAHVSELRRTHIGPWSDPASGQRAEVTGADVLPWLPTTDLHDDDWGVLKNATGTVSIRGKVRPARWVVPEGFPAPKELIVASHLGRVVALLERREGGVATAQLLLPPL